MEDYVNLKPSLNNYFTARNFVPIPPFMLNTINQSMMDSDGDNKKILTDVIQIIREYNREISEMRDGSIEPAVDTCSDILFWLYLASKSKINSIPTIESLVKGVCLHFKMIENMIGRKQIPDANIIKSNLMSSIQ